MLFTHNINTLRLSVGGRTDARKIFTQYSGISSCSVGSTNNIENNMNTIIHESCEFGHISEEVYDRIGIPRDRDSMGREVMRYVTISQESYQRTKCISHEHQIHLRTKMLLWNQQIESDRKELAYCKHHEKITHDDGIVGCLCKKLELGGLLSDAEIGTVNEE